MIRSPLSGIGVEKLGLVIVGWWLFTFVVTNDFLHRSEVFGVFVRGTAEEGLKIGNRFVFLSESKID